MMKGLWFRVDGLWNRLPQAVVCVIVSVIVFSSCERRDIYDLGVTGVPVIVDMDWRNLGSYPDGASIYFYPESGSEPYVFRTNSVTKAQVDVPSGYYTVVVFNRTPEEYVTMTFQDMEALGTAQANLSYQATWAGTADSVGVTVYEPENIVCGRTDHFQVHERSTANLQLHPKSRAAIDSTAEESTEEITEEEITADTCYSTPKRMVYTATIKVRVDTIQAAKSVKAYITGMARGEYLATRSSTEELATHVIDSWTSEHDAADYNKGYLTGTFSCFGLPQQYLDVKDPKNNRLVIKVLCVDGTTVITRAFDIGDLITQNDEELTDVTTVSTLVLPNVKPEDGKASGFDVNIEDWGDTISVVVPM